MKRTPKKDTDRGTSIGKSNQKDYKVDRGNMDAEKPLPKEADKWKNQRKNQ